MKIAEAYSAEQSGIKGAIAKADESSAGAAALLCVKTEKDIFTQNLYCTFLFLLLYSL